MLTVLGQRKSFLSHGLHSSKEAKHWEGAGGGPSFDSPLEQLKGQVSVDLKKLGGEGASEEFRVRGLEAHQSRVFLEGIPLTEAQFNGTQWALVSQDAVTEVDFHAEEIPVSLAQDGLGGALNLGVLNDSHPSLIGSKVGSFGYKKILGSLAASRRTALWMDYVESKEDFFYWDDRGTPLNSTDDYLRTRDKNGFQKFLVIPHSVLHSSPTQRLDFISVGAVERHDLPGSVRMPTEGNLTQWFSVGSFRHRLEARPWKMENQVYLKAQKDERRGGTDASSSFLVPEDSQGMSWGIRSSGQWDLAPRLALKETVAISRESFDFAGVEQSRTELPVSLETTYDANEWRATGAVLTHQYWYEAEETSHYFMVSPRFKLGIGLPLGVQFRGLIGGFYRAPSLYERYGNPRGFSPNLALKDERATKLVLNLDRTVPDAIAGFDALTLSYSLSCLWADDLIGYIQNSQRSFQAMNIGRSRIITHEWGVLLLKAEGPELGLAFSLLSTLNSSDIRYQNGKELPHRPRYQGVLSAAYPWGRFKMGYRYRLVGSSYGDLANEREVSGFGDHSLVLEWDSKTYGRFQLSGQNLTDVITVPSQVDEFSIIDYTTSAVGYPAPGRRFYLAWSIDL